VKWSPIEVGLRPPAVVTVTSIVPATAAGATAVMLSSDVTVKRCAGAAPKLTAVAPLKSWPVIVTLVPPAAGPAEGDTEPIPGAKTSCADTSIFASGADTNADVVPGATSPSADSAPSAGFVVNSAQSPLPP
jgi:hypothetical protein